RPRQVEPSISEVADTNLTKAKELKKQVESTLTTLAIDQYTMALGKAKKIDKPLLLVLLDGKPSDLVGQVTSSQYVIKEFERVDLDLNQLWDKDRTVGEVWNETETTVLLVDPTSEKCEEVHSLEDL